VVETGATCAASLVGGAWRAALTNSEEILMLIHRGPGPRGPTPPPQYMMRRRHTVAADLTRLCALPSRTGD
jgi:hypothetical protein